MRNIKLVIAYDGGRYRGWQRLADTEQTIQGKLEKVISIMVGSATEINGSGRTDAGVHARGQAANFHTVTAMPTGEMHRYLNQYLPQDIVVQEVTEATERFHARYNAVSKTYAYQIWNHWVPPVFQRDFIYHLPEPLDLERMEKAAVKLLGSHDFRNFSSLIKFNKSTVRIVESISVTREGHQVTIRISADGFLYNMVRIIIGTLVEIGLGAREPADIDAILAGKSRAIAGMTLPPQGLFLEEVRY